jgi:hypothetical protein
MSRMKGPLNIRNVTQFTISTCLLAKKNQSFLIKTSEKTGKSKYLITQQYKFNAKARFKVMEEH